MNPLITISYNNAINTIKKVLAVNAKRAKDKLGGMVYQDFTISAAEENACKVYIQTAVNDVVVDALDIVQGLTRTTDAITFRIKNTRWQSDSDDDFGDALQQHIINYAAMFTVYKIYQATNPQLVKEIEADANNIKIAIHEMIFYKCPPKLNNKDYSHVSALVAPT